MKQIALMLICLLGLLGCTLTPEPKERVVIQTRYKYLLLDDWIVAPVAHPTLQGAKWKSLSRLAIEYSSALTQCNSQLQAAKNAADSKLEKTSASN